MRLVLCAVVRASLFMLTLTQKFPDGSAKTGKLNLADLAGAL
jgi:hypothetical protein